MHQLLTLASAVGAQHSDTNWTAVAGWFVGVVGIIVGLIGASIGATVSRRERRRNRGYGAAVGQVEQHWKDYYTEEQVRALLAERGRLLEQMRLVVPDYARYIALQDRRQMLSDSINALYRQYDEITQRLADRAATGGELSSDLVEALAQDIVPTYLERQRHAFWVSLSITVLLLLAAVPLALPLLLPLAPLVGFAAPAGTSLLLLQVYAYVFVCGISYLIFRVAPARPRTPGQASRQGGLLRPLLLYVLLPLVWFTATIQFFVPYLMLVMGDTSLDSLAADPGAWKHAGLGILSAVLTAMLLGLLPSLRRKDERAPEDVVTYE